MAKNDYLARQRAIQQGFFGAGVRSGRQQSDPEIMGKDIFGKDRLIKIIKGVGEYIDKYQKAWEKDDETDYYRDKLDAALAEAYGVELYDSFLTRYETAPEYDYQKGKWK